MASEACLVVQAKDGIIKSFFSLDEVRLQRFGKIALKSLPMASPGSVSAPALDPGELRGQEASGKWMVCQRRGAAYLEIEAGDDE
jgi:hypothetical protein